MKNVKIIGTDLDATFLRSDRSISEYTINIVTKALNKGILFVPCSARNHNHLPSWFIENEKVKYLVASNGAIIIDNKTKEVIHHACIDGKLALKILDSATKVNPYWTVDTGDYLYASNEIIKDHEILGFDIKDPNNTFINTRTFIDDYHDIVDENTLVNKLHFVSKKNKEDLYRILTSFDEVDVTSSHPINFEIISTASGKGKALKKIMELENIDKTCAMAFGDNDNDIEMITSVTYGVAVANAKDSLKEIVPYQTLSNNEDGVAYFIEKNVL